MRAEFSRGMNSLSKADIELAINRLRKNEKHGFGDSTHYDCVVGADYFPPKAVIGLALQAKSGKTIYPKDFKGGLESKCFKVLEKNGFQVTRKHNVTWLFQGNPKVFDIDKYLITTGYKYWSCPKFHKEIQIGDKAFFYKCGKEAAVIAKGVIREVPTPRDKVKHSELLSDFNKEKREVLKVGVEIEETRVAEPEHTISRFDLVADEKFKENTMIKSRQSSVFKITDNQRKALENLWLKRKTEPRSLESKKGKLFGSRKAFIESFGATCKNWQWSWSFVNNDKRFVIFGEWQDRSDRKPGLILSPDWEIRNGRINRGFRQALEHMRLVEEEGYRLFTLPMVADESKEKTGGRVSIKDFTEKITEKALLRKADGWYAAPIDSTGNKTGQELGVAVEENNLWSENELKACIIAYVKMLDSQKAAKPFNKTEYYRLLAAQTGRSPKSIEYRMQNISFVLQLSGRNIINGLAPARNVGTNVLAKIEEALSLVEGRAENQNVPFVAEVLRLKNKPNPSTPKGYKNPKKRTVSSTTYERSPEVAAWILNKTNGKCENCGEDGPFITNENEPFLEVHHVHYLSEGGSDTIDNTVAVCPNCHRAFHFSRNKEGLREGIYKKIKRLRKNTTNEKKEKIKEIQKTAVIRHREVL